MHLFFEIDLPHRPEASSRQHPCFPNADRHEHIENPLIDFPIPTTLNIPTG
jgi:hypothetical protein